MAAKHVADPWEHVFGPFDFSKHRNLDFRPPNFNFGYDDCSSKAPFFVQESLSSPLDLGFLLPDLGSWNLDLGSSILDYEL